MEYKRRALSNIVENDIFDIEKEIPRRRGTSISLDEQLDEYSEYLYTGYFSFTQSILKGILNLICPCCYYKRDTIQAN
jgi:hypothetical protein